MNLRSWFSNFNLRYLNEDVELIKPKVIRQVPFYIELMFLALYLAPHDNSRLGDHSEK